SSGYAWGYIGSCIPFVASLLIVLGADKLGLSMVTAMAIAFAITAAWWLLMTVPLLKSYRQKYYVEKRARAIRESFSRIGRTFANIKNEKRIFIFL
ncbi:MFS transporter, partial [Acinetobacter sp. 163]|nr:MFS transporter [Acinetobacter sp. 163]